MPDSLARVAIHMVFSTHGRAPLIRESFRESLLRYLQTVINDTGCISIAAGGVADHVHLLFYLGREASMAGVAMKLKSTSAKWVKSLSADNQGFQWQTGYGAFSVGCSQLEAAVAYVMGQVEHHRVVSFHEEYVRFLEMHGYAVDQADPSGQSGGPPDET